jgi:putative phosphoesterase
MRVGLISDVHSNLEALQAVLKNMPRVDLLLCAGDLVGFCAKPAKALKLLSKRRFLTVCGDHDHATASGDFRSLRKPASEIAEWTKEKLNARWLVMLGSLPLRLELKLEGYKVCVVHGSWQDPLKGRMRAGVLQELAASVKGLDADILITGHTHVPFQQFVLGKLLINPGSVGQPRDRDPRASYAILELEDEPRVSFRRVEYDIERAKEAMARAGFPEEFQIRLLFGW